MILVVSSERDEHARVVLRYLDGLGAEARMLDLSTFPVHARLALSWEPDTARSWWQLPSGEPLCLSEVQAVWWRRPQPPMIDPAIVRPSHRVFAQGEVYETLSGLWLTLCTRWMNHPIATETAGRKVHQLDVARHIGLPIPRTCITNDPESARAFLDTLAGPAVYKAFSATEQEWRETRLVGDTEVGDLANVTFAPVIFQEYVEVGVDLRITVVGDRVFPAAIHSQDTAYPIDFRMDMNRARIEPAELPKAFSSQLLELMARLGLVYGAIDARRTPDGQHVFLEVNPAGQWLFVEQVTGQPISEAIAQHLAGDDEPEVPRD